MWGWEMPPGAGDGDAAVLWMLKFPISGSEPSAPRRRTAPGGEIDVFLCYAGRDTHKKNPKKTIIMKGEGGEYSVFSAGAAAGNCLREKCLNTRRLPDPELCVLPSANTGVG